MEVLDSNWNSLLDESFDHDWGRRTDYIEPGNQTGTLKAIDWSDNPEIFPFGTRLTVQLHFEYWTDVNEFSAVSPAITITIP